MLGELAVDELVVLGDHFARVWREGWGGRSRDVRRSPRPTTCAPRSRRVAGRVAERLREALPLIREDSWSPMETRLRLVLVRAGLPEPDLNVDVLDDRGRFLACVDLCYRRQRVAIEYQGMLHGARYARDVDRIEALRAAGWTVIQVTWPLLVERPAELVRRVERALRAG